MNNPNFLRDNLEMNNLVESVRYGLKTLLTTNEENLLNQELLNSLLQVEKEKKFLSSMCGFNLYRIYQNKIRLMQKIFIL